MINEQALRDAIRARGGDPATEDAMVILAVLGNQMEERHRHPLPIEIPDEYYRLMNAFVHLGVKYCDNEHDRFKYRKSNWKRKTKKVLAVVTKMFEDIAYGRRPNLHDIWTHAHELVNIGQTAIDLNQEASQLRKSKRVIQNIARDANMIESASQHLKKVSQTIGMPEDLPTFVSPLIYEASPETPTLEEVLASEDKS